MLYVRQSVIALSGMRHFLNQIAYRITFILYKAAAFFVWPVIARLISFERNKIGKCSIWAPATKASAVVGGVKYLETLDPASFKRLTHDDHVVFYSGARLAQFGHLFSVSEDYMAWKEPGVAVCVALSLILVSEQLSWARTGMANREVVIRKTHGWLREHDLPEGLKSHLVERYSSMVESQQN
jgi:hypothetical protein